MQTCISTTPSVHRDLTLLQLITIHMAYYLMYTMWEGGALKLPSLPSLEFFFAVILVAGMHLRAMEATQSYGCYSEPRTLLRAACIICQWVRITHCMYNNTTVNRYVQACKCIFTWRCITFGTGGRVTQEPS